MLNILIADDHSIVRLGLTLLAREALGESCKTDFAQTGKEVLDLLRKQQYDMLFCDLMMPDRKGIGLIGEALSLRPQLRIIVISVGPERDFAAECINSGAYAYINKRVPDAVFIEVIRSVAYDNGKHFPGNDTSAATAEGMIRNSAAKSFNILSRREREVILLLLSGQSLKEIGSTLSLSPSAASTLKARAFAKLNVSSVIELNRLAYYLGIDPDGALLP